MLDILCNPSCYDLIKEQRKSKYEELRGLYHQATGNLYFMDSNSGLHATMIRQLKRANIVDDYDTFIHFYVYDFGIDESGEVWDKFNSLYPNYFDLYAKKKVA